MYYYIYKKDEIEALISSDTQSNSIYCTEITQEKYEEELEKIQEKEIIEESENNESIEIFENPT